jgi:hemerythrin-like domain-containing protein
MAIINISERPVSMPGSLKPGTAFEQPFEMLAACHERVERMLTLLARLLQHLPAQGCDDQAVQAARDVMRYFDVAAPLHHQDEELHVFPLLLAGADASICEVVRGLQQDHRDMEAGWAHARVVLQAVVSGQVPGPADVVALLLFADLYPPHLQREDSIVYPAAQLALSAPGVKTMSEDMMRRRGLTT